MTHPPTGPNPDGGGSDGGSTGPGRIRPHSIVDAARAWARVAVALAELTYSVARRRAL